MMAERCMVGVKSNYVYKVFGVGARGALRFYGRSNLDAPFCSKGYYHVSMTMKNDLGMPHASDVSVQPHVCFIQGKMRCLRYVIFAIVCKNKSRPTGDSNSEPRPPEGRALSIAPAGQDKPWAPPPGEGLYRLCIKLLIITFPKSLNRVG